MRYSSLQKTIALSVGVLAMVILISYIVSAWTEPSQTPPAGNVRPPVQLSPATAQVDNVAGATPSIFINNTAGDDLLRLQAAGTVRLVVGNDGNVGIGTATPSNVQGWNRVLDVSGANHAKILATEQTASAVKVGLFAHSNWGGGPTGSVGTESNHPLRFLTSYTERMRISTSGNVGIGTASPGYKLDAVSGGATTARFGTASTDAIVVGGGGGKVNAGTYDPIFDIDGKKYATYLADFAGGTRIETSGVIKLENGSYLIDFDNLKEGSNLWLFWQISNRKIEDLVVILTPGFDGKVWYEKKGNTITFLGGKSGEVSYRLSAPRVDYQNWSNLVEDQSLTGIKVSDYLK